MSFALPWANEAERIEKKSEAESPPYEGSDLVAGKRIEVRWLLTDEDEVARTKWWGASLVSRVSPPAEWNIRYDPSEGFNAEEAKVRFLSSEHLERVEDCSDEAILRWRAEGEAGEGDDDEEEEGLVDLRDLAQEQDEFERETGQSIEATALQELQANMAPAQQQAVLAGYRTFADSIKSKLQELMENGGEDYVVTASDINRIVEGMKQK